MLWWWRGLLFRRSSISNHGVSGAASSLSPDVLPNASGGHCRRRRKRCSEVDIVIALQRTGGVASAAVPDENIYIAETIMTTRHLHVHANQRQGPRHKVLHRAVLKHILRRRSTPQ